MVDFSALQSRRDVAHLLGISDGGLVRLLYGLGVAHYYSTWELAKKSGGTRTISAPSSVLLRLQERLNVHLQAHYEAKPTVHGYVPGRSIATNAKPHVRARFVLNFDLEDFFPRINFGRVRGVFKAFPFSCSDEVATVLAQLCTFDGALPIGAPTSPTISNLVCRRLDASLVALAKRNRCWYTRYADDITISTRRPSLPEDIAVLGPDRVVALASTLNSIVERNGFSVNNSKTRVSDRHQSQRVTGLVVNRRVNVPRDFIREIRAMLHAWDIYGETNCQSYLTRYYGRGVPGANPPPFREVLRGKIAYLAMVRGRDDPIVQKLATEYRSLKYHTEQERRALKIAKEQKKIPVPPITIAHFSDFHFSAGKQWDSDVLLDKMIDYLRDSVRCRPDIVVVTGDIAQSGRADEYAIARTFFLDSLLPVLRAPVERLYFVPGNHDVDRSKVGDPEKSFRDSLLREPDDSRLVSALQDARTSAQLLDRFSAYSDFVASLRSDPALAQPWWRTTVQIGEINVALAGACTALLSQGDREHGSLLLGRYQINSISKRASTSDHLRIALLHHPFDWMAEQDSAAVGDLSNWAQIVLRGHLHRQAGHSVDDGRHRLVNLAAAASYDNSIRPCGFSVLTVRLEDSRCLVDAHKWDHDRRLWAADGLASTELEFSALS